ncbi:MAG: hypothetical protein KBB11_00455 [Bacteroidales bacterium]|nr:hypothetical protein [Bacteroidales bacterium]HOY38096.1 hypothetical protein [Bacteroidales bacterium]HQP04699.1 hypothetical protein [Bacteroidales bacterium]
MSRTKTIIKITFIFSALISCGGITQPMKEVTGPESVSIEPAADKTVLDSSCNDNIVYLKYYNDRFKYSINYPDFLTPLGEPDNNDGQAFRSNSGEMELLVFGNNLTKGTFQEGYEDIVKVGFYADPEYLINFSHFEGNRYEIRGKNRKDSFYLTSAFYGSFSVTVFITVPHSKEAEHASIIRNIQQSVNY